MSTFLDPQPLALAQESPLNVSAPVKTRDSNRNAGNDKGFHVTLPYSVITVIDKG